MQGVTGSSPVPSTKRKTRILYSASSFLTFCLPSALFQYFKKILGATWTPFLLGIHMRHKSVVPCANPIVFHAASPKYNCLPSRCLHKKQRLSLSCPVFTAVPQFSPPLSGRPKKQFAKFFPFSYCNMHVLCYYEFGVVVRFLQQSHTSPSPLFCNR